MVWWADSDITLLGQLSVLTLQEKQVLCLNISTVKALTHQCYS